MLSDKHLVGFPRRTRCSSKQTGVRIYRQNKFRIINFKYMHFIDIYVKISSQGSWAECKLPFEMD